MIKNKDIDFFLSYQFLYDEKKIKENFNKIKSFNIVKDTVSLNYDEDFYLEKIDFYFSNIVYKFLKNKKSIGLLLSGGLDSFLLLFYIRKVFPDIEIYSFTFLPANCYLNEIKKIDIITKKFNTLHTNIIKDVTFYDIKNGLLDIYKNKHDLIGDEGLIYNYIFLKEVKKIYKGKMFISGDGLDVIFGGLNMYKLSFIERNYSNEKEELFTNNHEEQYFIKKITKYDKNFFYKYGEFFGGNFLKTNTLKFFYIWFSKLKISSILKKQIYFNIFFLIGNRKNYIKNSGKKFNFKIFTPFIDDLFIKDILSLDIMDKFLISNKQKKIILYRLADKILKDLDINIDFSGQFHIPYSNIYIKNKYYIIGISKQMYIKGLISYEHFKLVPYFIKYSMWHENRMRIYLLINLYCFFIKK